MWNKSTVELDYQGLLKSDILFKTMVKCSEALQDPRVQGGSLP